MRGSGDDLAPRRAIAILVLLTLAGLALRMLGLRHESAWWDEYSSLVHLTRAGSLWQFLADNRMLDPATLPLYYSIEYFWSRLAGTDTYWMRMPSIAIGIAIVPSVYALGARIFSRRAGLVAAACIAFSPIHIFHAQGIRMYVLFTLLAVLSMLTFMNIWSNNRGWKTHALMQFLLSWTHPFALLMPLVQGSAWLAALFMQSGAPPDSSRVGGRARTIGFAVLPLLRWVVVTVVVWSPVLVYLSTVSYYPQDLVTWLSAPAVSTLLYDLFTDDVVTWDYALYYSHQAWRWLPWGLGEYVRALRPVLDVAFASTLLGAAALGLLRCIRMQEQRRLAVLLLAWVVLPVLVLYVASLLLRPMYAARYSVHSSIAIYLLAGAGVAALQGRLRIIASLLLLSLMLFQTSLLHPGPQRTDYLGAAQIIREQADSSNDVVIVTSDFEFNTFAYNFPHPQVAMIHAEGLPLAYLMADALLRQPVDESPRHVWIFHVIPYWAKYPEIMPEQILPRLGVSFDFYSRPAIQSCFLLRLNASAEVETRAEAMEELKEVIRGYAPEQWPTVLLEQAVKAKAPQSWPLLGAACQLTEATSTNALQLFCGDTRPIPTARARALSFFYRGADMMESEASLDYFRQASEADPTFGAPHMMSAVYYLSTGNDKAALQEWEESLLDESFRRRFATFVKALKQRDIDTALQEAEQLRAELGEYSDYLHDVVMQFAAAWGIYHVE